MYPDLSYLLHDLFGSELDNWTSVFKSFGLMLGIAFLACGLMLKSELKRIESEGKVQPFTVKRKARSGWGDIIINSLVTTLFAAKIPYIISHFEDFKANPASIVFSKLGNWPIGILLGGAFGAYAYYKLQKEGKGLPETTDVVVHPHERTTDIIFLAALSGIAGSRLFSILENFEDFIRDPIGQLFSGSGLTIYGGLIVAFIAVYWYVKKIGIRPVYMMDIAGMGILLGYAIGRIGCQIAGDGDWGIVASAIPEWWFLPDWLWSYNFPNNVNNDGVTIAGCDVEAVRAATGSIEARCQQACGLRYCHELPQPVYPTSVYETLMSGIGFLIFWSLRRKIKIAGMIFTTYMIYNGVERFFIEQIRVNEKYEFLGFVWSQAQYISVGFVFIGIMGTIYLYRMGPGWEKKMNKM